eukprot:TRINITY_DN7144_c0_g1_i1.p1 TRINITY_DN7144_c0_g1~~TRINITY_DN7144_c0_g1_i1.p1  ORF type:complete len:173 (+),score=34.89 TRINITY_DN7144_c0_g1_i1:120-638(+)
MALALRPTFVQSPKPTWRSLTMAMNKNISSSLDIPHKKKLPILLFDVMDTIVRDPFYKDVPDFFRMPMKELLESKHPTAWIEFEKGLINEMELATKFFKDGRHVDLEGKRKPAADSYLEVLARLGVEPASCIFVDDRVVNVEAAVNAGMVGLHFKSAASLLQDLFLLGILTS